MGKKTSFTKRDDKSPTATRKLDKCASLDEFYNLGLDAETENDDVEDTIPAAEFQRQMLKFQREMQRQLLQLDKKIDQNQREMIDVVTLARGRAVPFRAKPSAANMQEPVVTSTLETPRFSPLRAVGPDSVDRAHVRLVAKQPKSNWTRWLRRVLPCVTPRVFPASKPHD